MRPVRPCGDVDCPCQGAEQNAELRGEHERLQRAVVTYAEALVRLGASPNDSAACAWCISAYVECPTHGGS